MIEMSIFVKLGQEFVLIDRHVWDEIKNPAELGFAIESAANDQDGKETRIIFDIKESPR